MPCGSNRGGRLCRRRNGDVRVGIVLHLRGGIANGSLFGVARYNTDGSLDTTFGSGGLVTTAFSAGSSGINNLTIQSDGKIVGAGFAGDKFALARYLNT